MSNPGMEDGQGIEAAGEMVLASGWLGRYCKFVLATLLSWADVAGWPRQQAPTLPLLVLLNYQGCFERSLGLWVQ